MKMYQVVEIRGKKKETYMIGFETEQELTHWLNGKRAVEDENKYSIVAWKVNMDGTGYIDLDFIWNLYGKKIA